MNIKDIAGYLDGELICGTNKANKPVLSACGADLMSDVLAFAKAGSALLTGMVNQHVVRTAQMLDVNCIVFVRGKRPDAALCALAEEADIAIVACDKTLYESCGLLYQAGLPPCARV